MDMKNYIEAAEKKAGTQKKLAEILGITDRYIRLVKKDKQGFSNEICIVLADYINEDRLEVIAASSLVAEKDERKRKISESCFNRAATTAAAVAFLGVTSIVSPSPANASQASNELQNNLYYVNANRRRNQGRRFSDKLSILFDTLRNSFLHNRNEFYKAIGNTF